MRYVRGIYHQIKGQISPSVRFNIEQGLENTAYIHNLTIYLNKKGYCSNVTPPPKLVKKQQKGRQPLIIG